MTKRKKVRLSLIALVAIMAALVVCMTAIPAMAAEEITDTATGVTLYDRDGDGYYEIRTEAELSTLSSLVNGGRMDVDAELVADIEINGTWKPIGSSYRPYSGEFIGGGHTISNLYYNNTAAGVQYAGLFGYVGKEGAVRGVQVMGSYVSVNKYAGAIAGYNAGVVEGCLSDATVYAVSNSGGIVGYNVGYVNNSLFVGEVSGYYTQYTGGVVGVNEAKADGANITNCYAISAENYDNVIGSSSYAAGMVDSARVVSASEISSGEVAYLLSVGDGAWGQFIGTDATPILGGRRVYFHESEGIYSNYRAAAKDAEGYYEISDAEQLMWFAKWYNDGRLGSGVKARLTGDIDISAYEFLPIGSSSRTFVGIFDGGGYTVRGFNMTVTKAGDYGLFGYITGDTTVVKDFRIEGEVKTALTANVDIHYGVIGQADGKATVSGIHSVVNLTAGDGYTKKYVGGIVGQAGNLTVTACSFGGEMDLGGDAVDCVGGIVGYAYNGKTVNISLCSYYGKIISSYGGGNIGGILGYYNGENARALTVNECLSGGELPENGSGLVGTIKNYGTAKAGTDNYVSEYLYQSKTNIEANNVIHEDFTTGRFAVLTGGGWGQNIDNSLPYSSVPIYGAATVFFGYTSCDPDQDSEVYTNDPNASDIKPSHTEGTAANCTSGAICKDCGEEYTAKNANNHANNTNEKYKYEDGVNHTLTCSECSGIVARGEHTEGVAANCKKGAVCDVCNSVYTDVNPKNHANNTNENRFMPVDDEIHARNCTECGEAIETGEHTGGEANCMRGAICEICFLQYTEPDPTNHTDNVNDKFTPAADGLTHELICSACDAAVEIGRHEGGTASCGAAAECTVCGTGYGERPAHTFTDGGDGFCTECGGYQPAVLTEGKHDIDGDGTPDAVYEISNAGQLYWFAARVNGDDGLEKQPWVNAILTCDITLNSGVLDENGALADKNAKRWKPIGFYRNEFVGIFDGRGYTVSGLYVGDVNTYNGMFRIVGRGGVVKNLVLRDTFIAGVSIAGGVAAQLDGGRVEGCLSFATVSGSNLLGVVVGEVIGSEEYPAAVVGCVGAGRIILDSTASQITQGALVGENRGGLVDLCFYLAGSFDRVIGRGEGGRLFEFEKETLSTGALTLAMQGLDLNWGQTIGVQDYPVPLGMKVYYGYISCADDATEVYTNNPEVYTEKPEHKDDNRDHICDGGCGKADIGAHADSTDNDHLCDYGCGVALSECSDAEGDGNHACDICGAADVSRHDYGAATCDEAATCRECGEASDGAIGHDYVGVITREPTCTEAGETVYTCTRDASHTYREDIPASGHSYGDWVVTLEPSATEDGRREHTCACGHTEWESIPATGAVEDPDGGENADGDRPDGLSGGVIAVIVIGAVLLLGGGAAAVLLFLKKRR